MVQKFDDIFKKATFFSLILVCCFPLLKYGMISTLIIAFASLSIISNFRSSKGRFNYTSLKHIFINCAFYIVIIISTLYSENQNESISIIQKGLSFFIFPFTFFLFGHEYSRKQIRFLLGVFLIANFLLILYFAYYFYELDFYSPKNFKRIFTRLVFRKSLISHPYVSWHPSYLALWAAFCLIIIVDFYFTIRKKHLRIILALLGVIFFIEIFALQARTIFIGSCILIPILIYMRLESKKDRIKLLIVYALSLVTIATVINFNKTLRDRYITRFSNLINTDGQENTNKRYLINQCNFKLIMKKPLLGHGVGDVHDQLNDCYVNNIKRPDFVESNFNSHNYYAFLLLAGGVVLLTSFLYLIGNNILLAVNQKDLTYVGLLILISLSLLTENTLSRIHGFVFFSLFNSLFYHYNISHKYD